MTFGQLANANVCFNDFACVRRYIQYKRTQFYLVYIYTFFAL